ncbi:hypothetical protein A2Y83_00085 [Candidatus Falkowbacteria bacterium RBG_13_39_14]|uniref:Glycosyl transferase family 1 domain-containing protein n=1 Tax=Candidatus Falkowbacteria bacterium RBG_13_39_14 TaxID=1797985 RepID=A0A1F5S6Z5_9BACT|nr:MAG: hypothetical protein A2Y83_00085 [Candidatus Falkowbacteria bacterium RBG_13_39_14]
MKIAVVHDHLNWCGGGERTALIMAIDLNADFITAYANDNTFPDYQKNIGPKFEVLAKKIHLDIKVLRFFWTRFLFWRHRKKIKGYDILIASGQPAAEAVAWYGRKKALKILYNHTPPRRVFDLYEISRDSYKWFLRPFYGLFARFWKWMYLKAVDRFDVNIANSATVRERVKKYTKRDVHYIVRPPIIVDKFKWIAQGNYFLSWARTDEAKRVELIVKAFRKMPEQKLVVASKGSRLDAVRGLAEGFPNIEVLGYVPDEKLFDLAGRCRAAVYIPIDEDAGMTHFEANAAGKPVLGVAEGGLLDTIIDGETGILLKPNPCEEDIINGVRKMTPEWCLQRREKCVRHAAAYGRKIFSDKIAEIIKENNNQKKILGIDGSRWEDPRFPGQGIRTGVENAAKNIIENLALMAIERGLRVRVYTPRLIEGLPLKAQKIIPGRKRWTSWLLANELQNSPADYFFTPSYYIPANAPAKSFALIHDIIFKTEPKKYSLKERLIQGYALRKNLERAEKIITVSEYSKKNICEKCFLEPEKVIVAPLGCARAKNAAQSKREKFIFYAGRVEKKKSVDILIRAFCLFMKKHPDWRLILAGGAGYGYSEILEEIKKCSLDGKIILPGYVSDNEKINFFAGASIFAHPSGNEGSCMPLFEAWDARVPAIIADIPVMREIGKDAVLYFAPGDEKDLAEKMGFLAENMDMRKTLAEKGEERLKNMSWEKTAELILDAILFL